MTLPLIYIIVHNILIGKEENRARDLFYALWIPDLFMKRVQENGMWTLMCPHDCPGLDDVWGDEFEQLYIKWVALPGGYGSKALHIYIFCFGGCVGLQ